MWGLICYIISFLTGYFIFATYKPKKKPTGNTPPESPKRRKAENTPYKHLSSVFEACIENELTDCRFMIGVDFSASNEWQGRRTFSQQCLHHVSPISQLNPYQRTILAFGSSMAPVRTSQPIAAYGFGDVETKNHSVFNLLDADDGFCSDFEHVLECYKKSASSVVLSGPTSFAPIIKKAIDDARESRQYHILLIIADGSVNNDEERRMLKESMKFPLSIIMVGVGDGPWDTMHTFREAAAKNETNNFHFIEFDQHIAIRRFSENLLLHAFMYIPEQFKNFINRGMIQNSTINSQILPKTAAITPEHEMKLMHTATKAQKLKLRVQNSFRIIDSKFSRVFNVNRFKRAKQTIQEKRASYRTRQHRLNSDFEQRRSISLDCDQSPLGSNQSDTSLDEGAFSLPEKWENSTSTEDSLSESYRLTSTPRDKSMLDSPSSQ